MTLRSIFTAAILAQAAAVFAAPGDQPKGRTPEDILKSVKLPEGYSATVFAKAPELGYPTSVSAAADGTVFVAIDENGSLDRKEKRGRVIRLRDTNGDGVADEQKIFAEMDSPRGVIWDGASGTGPGTLYVMHPPNLTAYYDENGDGVSDRQEELVTGLGFGLDFRGADHTTNGCQLGIDGYLYVAVGDYGYTEAKGKDGTTIKNRGGGIVRVRTDGTGLEIVSRGQRNIYDVAVSPTLDLFTRDNTNDGGGWNVRLSHVPPGAHMGYPTLFKNFAEDMLQPLADYGGGSPCGALWLDEPGLPMGLFTVEWGASAIMQHTLKPKGAGWELDGPDKGQKPWINIKRPTDMDVDASGRIYITSWEGATFNYNGPFAGYVLRVVKNDAPKVEVPDFSTLATDELLKLAQVDSAKIRQTAQREIARKIWISAGKNDQPSIETFRLQALDEAKLRTNEGKLGAAYTLGFIFLEGSRALKATGFGLKPESILESSPAWRRLALVMLGDGGVTISEVGKQVLVNGLTDADATIRSVAITGLRRTGKADAAANILPLVADADPVLSHLAIRALGELKAADVCLGALDSSDEQVKPGALRALYSMYEPKVVDGLIARLASAKGETRQGILNALCRLANQDTPYTDPKVWWGTRPDTSGPVYQPMAWSESDKIIAALKSALDQSTPEDARLIIQRMYLTKVPFPNLVELMLTSAGNDTPAKLTALSAMFSPDNILPDAGLAALVKIATNKDEVPELRARSLRLLQKANQQKSGVEKSRIAALDAAVAAFSPLAGQTLADAGLSGAFEDFTRAVPAMNNIYAFENLALGADPTKRTLAQTILVNLATSTVNKGKEKEYAIKAIDKAWARKESVSTLLGVVARTKAKSMAEQVKAHLKDPDNAVAEAALYAYQTLGLSDTAAPMKTIGEMPYEATLAAVSKGGDVKQGQEMFLRSGCIACHTVSDNEPPKGPNLAATVKIYDRAALTESILKPNAKIAQGFETQWFKTRKGEQVEGFVTREGGDSVDVRNIAGQTQTLEKGDVAERGKHETSMMPEGLLNTFSPTELASLLAYLESLKGK